jgi:hypothetical protein
MHHENRRPCWRSRPCHERSTGDIKETPGGQLGDSKGPAGRHSEGSKSSYMDQCTFGAVRPWGGRGAVRKRQSQNLGRAREEIRPSSSRMRSSGLQEGRRAASRLSPPALGDRCAPPLAPSLRLAVSPRRPILPVPVRAAGADTRAGQSNPAAAKTADEAPPRLLADASIMPHSSRSPAFGDLNATRVSRSRRWPPNFPLQRDRGFRP